MQCAAIRRACLSGTAIGSAYAVGPLIALQARAVGRCIHCEPGRRRLGRRSGPRQRRKATAAPCHIAGPQHQGVGVRVRFEWCSNPNHNPVPLYLIINSFVALCLVVGLKTTGFRKGGGRREVAVAWHATAARRARGFVERHGIFGGAGPRLAPSALSVTGGNTIHLHRCTASYISCGAHDTCVCFLLFTRCSSSSGMSAVAHVMHPPITKNT